MDNDLRIAVTDDKELQSLLKLIDDHDGDVGAAVVKQLVQRGQEALPLLLPLLNDGDECVRDRAGEAIDAIASERCIREFEECVGEKNRAEYTEFDEIRALHGPENSASFVSANLELGCVALARVAYPQFTREMFDDALGRFARTLGRRMEHCATDGERVLAITRYFFVEELFAGNADDYYNPDNSFINRVLDTRRGIPISLAAIIMLTARRIGLPVHAVNMPAHFLLRYRTHHLDAFIDPFYGRLLSKEDCIAIAGRSGVDIDTALEEPGDLDILIRMINNAVYACDKRGDALLSRVLRACLAKIKPEENDDDAAMGEDDEQDPL